MDNTAGRAKRNAMGEYIVPPGEKPLTSLGDCNPSPADYLPKMDLTKPAAPQYSIAGPYKSTKGQYHACSADNDTSRDMEWNDRTIRLKGKGKMRPYDIRDDAHVNDSVGPARYKVEHKKTGAHGAKYSMGYRHLEGVNAGHPNALVHPVDTHGVDNPAPTYRPNSSYWGHGSQKSFGLKRKDRDKEGPGPGEYESVETLGSGPAYSMARRLPPPLQVQQAINTFSPGPGFYEVGTTVGKAMSKSISGRHAEIIDEFAPAPNMYTFRDYFWNAPHAATLAYKRFEPKEGPHPGPTQYSVKTTHLKKAPGYSMRKLNKPCFPDILNYPILAELHHNPGPGHYKDNRNLSSNDKPKFSMGKILKAPKDEIPGPNSYKLEFPHRPDAERAPEFSMGARLVAIDKRVGPGPAAYNPQHSKGGPGYSMSSRPKSGKKFNTPAPNAYSLKKGQTCSGTSAGPVVTFKSRASPYIYSGFRSTAVSK